MTAGIEEGMAAEVLHHLPAEGVDQLLRVRGAEQLARSVGEELEPLEAFLEIGFRPAPRLFMLQRVEGIGDIGGEGLSSSNCSASKSWGRLP